MGEAAFGLWSLAFGLWPLVFGLWCSAFGLGSFVFGLASLPQSGYVPKLRVAASATLGYEIEEFNRKAVASTGATLDRDAKSPAS
jgi:hypothetical protein